MKPMRPLLAFVSFLLLLHATRSDASAADSNPIIECQLCINTLAMLANYSLEDPKIVDWLMAHAFDAASAAGLCAKDGGPSGVLTPDVCLGAIGEYGPVIANIVAARPPLVRETVEFVCEALKLCPIASLSEVDARERGATCESSPPPALHAAPPRSKSARDVEQGSGDVGTFVVITDIHWDPDYSPGSYAICDHPMCCRANFGAKRGVNSTLAGPLGDYNCDATLALLQQSVAFAASLTSDFVLFTGDLPAHDVWNQSLSANVDVLSRGTELLLRAFGASKTLLPSLGNHDTFPADSFSPDSSAPIYAAIQRIWSPLLPAAALETVALGGYYSVSIVPGLRAIALNSMWGDPLNFYASLGNVSNSRERAWVEDELRAARAAGEKVYILGHIPPGVLNTDVISWNAISNWTQWYSSIADEFSDVIAAHFAGHTHKDEKRIFYGRDGRAAAVAHVLPSVTTQINRNPSVMQFKYNRTTFELLDYTVYYSNVTRANEDGYFTFAPFYSALEYYGLADMSAASWQLLFENMRCDVSVFEKYLKAYYSGFERECDAGCRRHHICATQQLQLDSWILCMNNGTRGRSNDF